MKKKQHRAWDDEEEEEQDNQVREFQGVDYEPPPVVHDLHSIEIPKTKAEMEAKVLTIGQKEKPAVGIDGELDEENLGEDFELTPWLPPSLEKATEYKMQNMFRQGQAPLWGVKVCKDPDLGVGVCLYFQFVKSMGICLAVMTILAIPTAVFAWFGERIPQEEQDAIGLYRFTLGNIGYNKKSTTYSEDSQCNSYTNSTNTCIHLYGGYEMLLVNAASIVTLCEILQCIVFLGTVTHMSRLLEVFEEVLEQENTSVTDYSIMVTNLPKDCNEMELLTHFSNLYPLDKVDWRGRPPLHAAKPVEHCDNTQMTIHCHTWVAECSIFRKIGKLLSAFKNREYLTKNLHRYRAQMKMFSENTPHSRGPNPGRYERAQRRMVATAAKVDMLAERLVKLKQEHQQPEQHKSAASGPETQQSMVKAGVPGGQHHEPQELEAGQHQNHHVSHVHNSLSDTIHADPVAGFVVFEYSESMARCVEDYRRYSSFPFSLFFPQQLRFKGNRLKVRKAAEPDQIGWEFLEVSMWEKRIRRIRSVIVATILLVVCFAIIVQGSIYKTKFSNQIPVLSFCSQSVPELYGSAFNITNYKNYRLTRPIETVEKTELDAQCEAVVPGTFYAVMAENGDYYYPIGTYNVSECLPQRLGLCPRRRERHFCPCVSISSDEECSTLQCDSSNPRDAPLCKQFPARIMGNCFCYQNLLSMLTSGGVSATLNYIRGAGDDVCYPFFVTYGSATALTYGATVITVLINLMLATCLEALTKMEAHTSVDKQEASLMNKLFISIYLNMGVVVLIAFGYISGVPQELKYAEIFQGIYDDFTSAWYGSVGNYLVITFAIQAASSPVGRLLSYLVFMPFSRCMNYAAISGQSSYKVPMQQDLNDMEVGEKFDICRESAMVTALLFFAMTYSTGIPVLLPLAAIAFFYFFEVNKVLLCRYHERPPHISDGMIRSMLYLMPYAVIIRLAVACWMLGNPDIFPATFPVLSASTNGVSTNAYVDFLDTYRHYGNYNSATTYLAQRVARPNVFLLFIIIVLIVLVRLISMVWRYLPIYWVMKCTSCLFELCCRRAQKIYADNNGQPLKGEIHGFELLQLKDPLRQEMAPFTGDYYKYLLDKDHVPTKCVEMCTYRSKVKLTEDQEVAGWAIIDQGKYLVQCKLWTQTVNMNGVTRLRGSCKRTYELINEHGCSSYSLSRIPTYKLAMRGILEGAKNLKDYKEQKEKDQAKRDAEKPANKASTAWADRNSEKTRSGKKKKKKTASGRDGSLNDDNNDSNDDDVSSGSDSEAGDKVEAFAERPHYGRPQDVDSDDDDD